MHAARGRRLTRGRPTADFGKVFQVRKTQGHNAGSIYAMKVLGKASIEVGCRGFGSGRR